MIMTSGEHTITDYTSERNHAMFFDYYYILWVLPAVIFAIWASARVSSTFQKYSSQISRSGLSGSQAARRVLEAEEVYQVQIERTGGSLTDHYDPRTNVIRLSDSVCDQTSTAAIGVAAHEAGHAIQYARGYLPIKIRNAIIPVTNIGSRLALPLILIGLLFAGQGSEMGKLAYLGVFCFGLSTLFQVITLPVEFDASRRALRAIENAHILTEEELSGARKVLTAAALTYVAALAVSLTQLFRLLAIVNRRNGRE